MKATKEFKEALALHLNRAVTGEEIEVALRKFNKSREWDMNHPIYDKTKPKPKKKLPLLERLFPSPSKGVYRPSSHAAYELKNPPAEHTTNGYAKYFREFEEMAKDENNAHLNMSVIA